MGLMGGKALAQDYPEKDDAGATIYYKIFSAAPGNTGLCLQDNSKENGKYAYPLAEHENDNKFQEWQFVPGDAPGTYLLRNRATYRYISTTGDWIGTFFAITFATKKAIDNEDIVLKSEGKQYFSYTYVADAVAGLLTVLLYGENGMAYNVSSEKTNVHLRDFAQMCADYNGRKVVFDLPTETEAKGYSVAMQAIMSNERIKGIGFTPYYNMADAVRRTIEILKAN